MELLENPQSLLETSEHLRKILQYRREELLSINLYSLIIKLRRFLNLEPRLYFNELLLEILNKLSYSLYIKSTLILNLLPPITEEETVSEQTPKERLFSIYQTLPLGRLLHEKVFLPKINGFEFLRWDEKKGDLSELLKAFLDLLDRVKREPSLTLDLDTPSIEEYLERLKNFLESQKITTWEKLIQRLSVRDLKEKVYLFLALLFLVFEGFCGVHQEEQGTIHIFMRV